MVSSGSLRAYFDHNASMPLRPQVREAMVEALDFGGNPSSVHAEGRAARRLVEQARRNIASLVNVDPSRIIFTSGATEAANSLASPLWTLGRASLKFSRLYMSATEHPCIQRGHRFASDAVEAVPVDGNGRLDLDHLRATLRAHDKSAGPALVAVQAANNETGIIQPIAQITEIVRESGATLIVDAVQVAGRLPLEAERDLGDYSFISSHKIGGPKGIGAIIANSDIMMPVALVQGGGQEHGHRAGTENVLGIIGFGAAAIAAKHAIASADIMVSQRSSIEEHILSQFGDAIIHGAGQDRLPNTIFFSIPGMKAETLQIAMDLAGVAVSAGSACSSGKVGPSQVLAAMGRTDESGLRISFGPETSDAEFALLKTAITTIANRRSAGRAA